MYDICMIATPHLTRRWFLGTAAALTLPSRLLPATPKPLRGIFPIMQTPFTDANQVDNAVLAKQVDFLEKCGVHGMVWPQLASEYFHLTEDERLAGAEAILAAAANRQPAIVIGVQADDAPTAAKYARHAAKHKADALIALPPRGEQDQGRIERYYQRIGETTPLPLFIQAIGDMSVESIIGMSRRIPTLRYIKDEAGPPLPRITEFRKKAPELYPFTGNHGRTLYDEMLRGVAGTMPASGFIDLYVSAWEHFHSGRRREAAEFCARSTLLIPMAETYGLAAMKYLLHLRGVFPTWRVRQSKPGDPLPSPSTARRQAPLDEQGKQALRELLAHLKPYLRV